MKHKSEVFDKFKEFEATTTNEVGKAIGTLRTDNGGEFFLLKGIRHELTVPHSPHSPEWCSRKNESDFGRVGTLNDRTCRSIEYLLG